MGLVFNFLNPLRKPRNESRRPNVVLYTRQGCHLCEIALTFLSQSRSRFDFALEVLDVDSNPDWVGKYDQCVPVVVVDGKERFRGQVNPVLFQRLMKRKDSQALDETC